MAAPDLTQKLSAFVQKEGTDDPGANTVGHPFSRLTIDRALLDLADTSRYPAASLAYPHIVGIGPGTFVLDQLPPPFTWFNGSDDGQGQPTTILTVAADLVLPLLWNANQTMRGGLMNCTIQVSAGTPALDLTMPVPVAGNPIRVFELFNVHHNLPSEIFEATSLNDFLVKELCRYYGANTGTFRQTGGTSRLNNVWSNGLVTIIDKTAFPAVGNWDGLILSDPAASLTAQSIAAVGTTLRLSNSSIRALLLSQTAPGVLAVTTDVASMPVRSAITVAGTATVAANLTLLNDAQSLAYSPGTPANWSPVPVTVQQGLDTLAAAAAAATVPKLKITYTGGLQQAILMQAAPAGIAVPPGALSGQQTYSSYGGLGTTSAFSYSESAIPVPGRQLLTISFDDLATLGGGVSLATLAPQALTTLSFPVLTYCGSINILSAAALVTLDFPMLKVAVGIIISGCPLITTLRFNSLLYLTGNFQVGTSTGLVTLESTSLTDIFGNFAPASQNLLTSLNFPALVSIGGNFTPNTMAILTTLSFPALQTIAGNLAPLTMAACTTVSFPALVRCLSAIAIPSASMGNVASVTLGTVGVTKQLAGATITLSGLKLPSANVNAILALLVSLDGTNGTTLWGAGKTLTINGGTNGAPTGQGIIDKATLIARTATVTTN